MNAPSRLSLTKRLDTHLPITPPAPPVTNAIEPLMIRSAISWRRSFAPFNAPVCARHAWPYMRARSLV